MTVEERCEAADITGDCGPVRYVAVVRLEGEELVGVWCGACTGYLRELFHRDPRLVMVASVEPSRRATTVAVSPCESGRTLTVRT